MTEAPELKNMTPEEAREHNLDELLEGVKLAIGIVKAANVSGMYPTAIVVAVELLDQLASYESGQSPREAVVPVLARMVKEAKGDIVKVHRIAEGLIAQRRSGDPEPEAVGAAGSKRTRNERKKSRR